MDPQNNRERLLDQLERGLTTVQQANIEMVRAERFRVIHHLPRDVRKALNLGVKSGLLCHLPRDGAKPEVYYHPNFKHLATAARDAALERTIAALKATCAPSKGDQP